MGFVLCPSHSDSVLVDLLYFPKMFWNFKDLNPLLESKRLCYLCTCWPRAQTLRCGGWRVERGPGLLDLTGCPGSVITVLMLSPSKVQYCDNWRMAANLTRVHRIRARSTEWAPAPNRRLLFLRYVDLETFIGKFMCFYVYFNCFYLILHVIYKSNMQKYKNTEVT